MALIDLLQVNKKFGEKIVLNEVNLSINENDKIAIIGKNGEGKSTLLNIIFGSLMSDSGKVVRQNFKTIALLSQKIEFDNSLNLLDAIKKELDEIYKKLKEYDILQEKLSKDPNDKFLLKQIDELIGYLDLKDAWNIEQKIIRFIKEFELFDFKDRSVNSLSGGELRRAGLCMLLLKSPDILLLDEPTNHLDVYMCSFLEQMLNNSKSTLIFISHDRYFIDNVATKCIELEEGNIRIFEGSYKNYLEKKAAILVSLAKSHETLLKQLKSEEEWLRRGVKARLKRNEGRKERIFKMREEAKKNPSIIRKMKLEIQRASKNFNQTQGTNRKKMLFELKNASKSVNNKILFENFSVRILQGEKIAIVGKNGCGKSTFLKILLNQIPLSSGEFKSADIKIGYFDQNKALVNNDKTLIELFCPNGGDRVMVKGKNMHVYGYLKNFLFPKEFLDKPLSVLSGGEKSRVLLALLFTQEYDVLILDEPTNDLDIATINILEEYLLSFEGAILLVSHDRYFVDKIANKLFAFENKTINIEHISYSEYLENEAELKEFDEFERKVSEENIQTKVKEKTKTKLSYKENQILTNHPDKIENLEKQIKQINDDLSNPAKYQEIGVNILYEKLNELENELAILEQEYFDVLSKLD